ncbi:unnamed protein product [Moneuplotes crassus]|uniref:Uncharacterized protein n=1 Tax=Euplotes crassus TaxID=5936 RepID=A0AAD1UJB9_EUPCR|nr:unnamed protein product [Moneuplotes crassus]
MNFRDRKDPRSLRERDTSKRAPHKKVNFDICKGMHIYSILDSIDSNMSMDSSTSEFAASRPGTKRRRVDPDYISSSSLDCNSQQKSAFTVYPQRGKVINETVREDFIVAECQDTDDDIMRVDEGMLSDARYEKAIPTVLFDQNLHDQYRGKGDYQTHSGNDFNYFAQHHFKSKGKVHGYPLRETSKEGLTTQQMMESYLYDNRSNHKNVSAAERLKRYAMEKARGFKIKKATLPGSYDDPKFKEFAKEHSNEFVTSVAFNFKTQSNCDISDDDRSSINQSLNASLGSISPFLPSQEHSERLLSDNNEAQNYGFTLEGSALANPEDHAEELLDIRANGANSTRRNPFVNGADFSLLNPEEGQFE